MIVDNLKARCVDLVAREMGRSVYNLRIKAGAVPGDYQFQDAINECRPAAAEKINEMNNMQLLDIISEVLVSE